MSRDEAAYLNKGSVVTIKVLDFKLIKWNSGTKCSKCPLWLNRLRRDSQPGGPQNLNTEAFIRKGKSYTQMGFNINTSKGRCPHPTGPWLPPVQVSAMLQPGPHCSQQQQTLKSLHVTCQLKETNMTDSDAICMNSTYSLGFRGNKKVPTAKHIFSKSWMEACDIPLLNKQNRIN